MKKLFLTITAAGILCFAGNVFATQSTTSGFGVTPGAPVNMFGGSGIPQNTTMWSQTTGIQGNPYVLPDTLTIAMSITQHGSSNPAPGNDGAGTYTVGTGLNGGASTWNFDIYGNSLQNRLSDYTFTVTILNVGNGLSMSFNPLLIPDNVGGPSGFGNSERLDFSVFGGPISYNPFTDDTYKFYLDAYRNGNFVNEAAVTAVAGNGAANAPDGGPTVTLFALGLASLGGFKRLVKS